MNKNVYSRYCSMSTKKLTVLRSKKYNRRIKLEHEPRGYFNDKETDLLLEQLRAIDAVLASRDHQPGLFS